jgi:tetratricopeptide (TPR) repeat protein
MKPEILNALSILESEPDNAGALAQLAAAAEGGGNGKSDPAAQRALSEARRAHRERGDYDLVLRLADFELGWEKDPGRRADVLYEKGRVLSDELWREGEAEDCFQRVLKERPDDEGATEALAHIALVKDAWSKIVKKYLDEAKGSTDRQLTTSLYVSVAEVYAKNQPGPEVEAWLRKALEVEPRNKKAAVHLDRLLRAADRWTDVAALIEQRLESAAAREEKVALLTQLAELQRDRNKRPDLALDAMRRALAIDPTHSRAMGALVDAYTGEENWHGLLKLYENALKARPRGDAEIAILLQLGMVWWKKLANIESAEPHFSRVKKTDPAHPLMLAFYRAYHTERNEAAKLLQVLQAAQRAAQDPKRRLAIGIEMAEVAEGSAGNAEKAIDTWKGVLKQNPGSPEAVAALKRLYTKTEKWNALLELLKEQIDAVPKDTAAAVDERVSRLLEVVAIYRDKLNLDVMVINTYNQILALKPDHAGALGQLAQKYETMGRWNDLIGVLTRTADVTADPAAKARLLRRIAQLWVERFGNHNQAVKPLEELYALNPNDSEAIAQLRDIYTRRRSWRALLDLERRDLDR